MRKIMNNTEGSLGLSQRMSFVSTAVLIILMLCYLIMTISNSTSLADQTEIISNHPFEVVISAGDVKLYVSEMSLRTGRLVRHFSGADVAFARTKLEELEHSLDIPVAEIEELYLGDAKDVQALKDTLALLRTEQTDYLDFCAGSDVTAEEIETYAQEYLQPLYDRALQQTEEIISIAQEKKVGYGVTAERLRVTTLIGSILLMGLIIAVLLVSQ